MRIPHRRHQEERVRLKETRARLRRIDGTFSPQANRRLAMSMGAPAILFASPPRRSTGDYFNAASLMLRRDFFRLAVARGTTPAFTALSKAESASRKAVFASSFLPVVSAAV